MCVNINCEATNVLLFGVTTYRHISCSVSSFLRAVRLQQGQRFCFNKLFHHSSDVTS